MNPKILLICTLALALPPALLAQEKAAERVLPFSPARKAGPTLYISGQVARSPEGKQVTGGVAEETRQIMENIGRILRQHGYDFGDVVQATVWLRDIGDYREMNAAYAPFFKGEYPTRACIGGVDLVPGYNVEIRCTAYKEP